MKLMLLYVFLLTFYLIERNNFAKAFLREALIQIKLILWFFGFKTFQDNNFVNKTKLFIKKNQEDQLLLFSTKSVTVGWF